MNLLNVQGDEFPKTFECFFIDGLKSAVRNAPTASGICKKNHINKQKDSNFYASPVM